MHSIAETVIAMGTIGLFIVTTALAQLALRNCGQTPAHENEGRAAMYVIGRFTYRDAFGKERKDERLVWRGPYTGLQQFSTGNEAT